MICWFGVLVPYCLNYCRRHLQLLTTTCNLRLCAPDSTIKPVHIICVLLLVPYGVNWCRQLFTTAARCKHGWSWAGSSSSTLRHHHIYFISIVFYLLLGICHCHCCKQGHSSSYTASSIRSYHGLCQWHHHCIWSNFWSVKLLVGQTHSS